METTAQFVARARKALGWSQEKLAKFLKVTRETVGRWERGEHDMRLAVWRKLDAKVQQQNREAGK